MKNRVLVVDDDYGTLKLIENLLIKHNFEVEIFQDAQDALNVYHTKTYECILSDYYMPDIDGPAFLNFIRKVDKRVPFIILTVNTNIKDIISILKEGADDYIVKPIIEEDLIFRINKNIEDKELKIIAERIKKEQEIIEYETESLVNWKLLYATKDIEQTEQLIKIITRNLNHGGAFLWLDLLRNNITKVDEDNYQINKSLVELIIKSSEENKKFFDVVSYLSSINSISYNFVDVTFKDFYNFFIDYVQDELQKIALKYDKKVIIEKNQFTVPRQVSVDYSFITKVIKELIINAIKYSPEKSDIIFGIEKNSSLPGKNFDIYIKNKFKKLTARNPQGEKILGIPYEYSELVFNLFYTIESFPTTIDEEDWINGTGLYICRKILRDHKGWIKTTNEIDYSKGSTDTRVKFTVTLPFK